jgi:predicted SAM-dependent methyltransferase
MTGKIHYAIRQLKLRISFMRRKLRKPALPKNENGKVLLHVGCGKINSPEFINIDAQALPHVHVVTADISSLGDFSNDSVDLVYMCHILEHIKKDSLVNVLTEMKRILKKEGVLRLSVPDFDRLIEVYIASDRDVDSIHPQLMGGQDHAYNFHYSVFNRRNLSDLLEKVGFCEITPWDPYNCQYHNFKDKAMRIMTVNGKQFPISLNLEAIK